MAKDPGSPVHDDLAARGILREIRVNLLECKVCFEGFDGRGPGRGPRTLPCGHVLCLECTAALSHPLLRRLECPFCRRPCATDDTSHCQVLLELQDLTRSSAPPCRREPGGGPARAALRFSWAFGGWGALVNPTGLAVLPSCGSVVVVHDGDQRVKVFSPQGVELRSFGPREEVRYALGVAVTPCGRVAVTDAGGRAVKVFTSGGDFVLTIAGGFQLPWGVDADGRGRLLVSDPLAGSLSRVRVDYGGGGVLELGAVLSDLQGPRSVACCRQSGTTAVVEHLEGRSQRTRLSVFTPDFHLLYRADGFSLSLRCSVRLGVWAAAFDGDGGLAVSDSGRGMVWSLGEPTGGPAPTPLVGHHLIRPLGLVSWGSALLVLDAGDHAVKVYSSRDDERR